MDPILLFFLIAMISFIASCIQSVTGFGYGIVAMIFLPSLLLYTEANVLSSILSTATSVLTLLLTFRNVNWKNLVFPIIGSVIANYFAISFIKTQTNDTLIFFLGIALFALSMYFFFFSDKIRIKQAWYTGLIAGTVSGVMSGMFSIGGPPVVVYYMQSEKNSDIYLATISAYFVLSGFISIGMKFVSGFVTSNVWIGIAVGAIGMAVGSLFGNLTRTRIKPVAVKKAVYGLMAASGVVNVVISLI